MLRYHEVPVVNKPGPHALSMQGSTTVLEPQKYHCARAAHVLTCSIRQEKLYTRDTKFSVLLVEGR